MTEYDVIAPIAITMGDAAGIGPEIIVKAYCEQPDSTRACFVVGDVHTMRRAAALLHQKGVCESELPVVMIEDPNACRALPTPCIAVLQAASPLQALPFGEVNAAAGAFAGACIVWAAQAAMRNQVAAIVTAPIHKEAFAAAGDPYSRYPGHTELLQAVAAQFQAKPISHMPVRMMLMNEQIRTVLVSIHLSLRDAVAAVTYERVLETLMVTHAALHKLLGRPPQIGVAGLNPHAGEGGLFGREELEVIAPAIATARQSGCSVSGPWAPDTVFMRARHACGRVPAFDVVVAMYHDQGLIPVKYLGVEQGVNVTLGLPLVRTSPDHGTAFDIAGTGRADASSLVAALRAARKLTTF
jgi:4-hydroxythreonine-4-phosphate dehydrogenase